MSAVHQYVCDSCKLTINAEYNGEHYLVPKHWVQMKHPDETYAVGHLCGDCVCVSLHIPLRIKFASFLKRYLGKKAAV
jgi:hypothetical protein